MSEEYVACCNVCYAIRHGELYGITSKHFNATRFKTREEAQRAADYFNYLTTTEYGWKVVRVA